MSEVSCADRSSRRALAVREAFNPSAHHSMAQTWLRRSSAHRRLRLRSIALCARCYCTLSCSAALWESDPYSYYREGQVVECSVLHCDPAERRLLLTLLSPEEASTKSAAALLARTAIKRAAAADASGASPASKRLKLPEAAEQEEVDDEDEGSSGGAGRVRKLRNPEEAKPGTHALASAVALGEHGQILCRLDARGTMVGRVHMSELADPGKRAKVRGQAYPCT